MSQWRVLVGMDIDDPAEAWSVRVNATFPTWGVAAATLDKIVRRWLADTCPVCVRDAEVTLRELAAATPGEPFTGNIEGDDYALRPA